VDLGHTTESGSALPALKCTTRLLRNTIWTTLMAVLLSSLDQGTALAAKPIEMPLAVLTYAVGKVPGDAYLLLRSRRADLG
jgi:hypothetical protein